jgi:hypothetical protein
MNRLRTWPSETSGIDVHQHLWPEGLIEALRARRTPPRLHGWTLELAGEPDYAVDPRDHDVALRTAQAVEDGLELALVSLSSPLGIESLPPEEALELLEAYHDGVLGLPAPFGGWAAACLTEVDPRRVARELDRGFVGLQLPATALLDRPGYERMAPLLELLEEWGRPLLVHPGPVPPADRSGSAAVDSGAAVASVAPMARMSPTAPAAPAAPAAVTETALGGSNPAWWPAIVSYVQQMYAAWFAFRVHGRPRHPRLRVCFTLLAGLAPLHGERFTARTGERGVVDSDAFLEVSSYGTRAIDAAIRVLGIDVLVNGSDRPYSKPVELGLGAAAAHAVRRANPLRLLYPKEVSNDMAIAACA